VRIKKIIFEITYLQSFFFHHLSATIQIARLPRRSHNILSYVDQVGQVSGWGSLTDGTDAVPAQHLRFARLPIITHLTCQLALSFLNITDRNICTRSVDGTPCLVRAIKNCGKSFATKIFLIQTIN
jgi:hypothetical protein